MSIKILIADDDALIRDGLKIIIGMDPSFQVIGCVTNGQEAVDFCLANSVDVVLLDVRMPVMNGVEAAARICNETNSKVLILTTFDDDEYITDAIASGAKGYLLKNNAPDRIKDAIRLVHEGNSVIQDVVLEKMKSSLGKPKAGTFDKSMFTERELEVMEAIARGQSNKEVAATLFISEGTVKNYISTILDKTGLEHRTQVAIYYLNGAVKK